MTIAEITPSSFAEEPPPGPAASLGVTRTLAGSTYLRITASYDLSLGAPTLTIADNNGKAGTFAGPFDAANDGTAGQGGVQFVTTTPTTAGSCTITVSCSGTPATVFALTINVQEFSGSIGPQLSGGHTSNLQASPGTGTDAVTSGNLTPIIAPAMIAGLTMDLGGAGAASPSAGTGFTDAGSGWDLGVGHNLARAESKRVTSTAAVAATFTTGTNDRFGTWAAIFIETPQPDGYMQPPVIPPRLQRAALFVDNWDPLPGLPSAAAVVGVFTQQEQRRPRPPRAEQQWEPLAALPSALGAFTQQSEPKRPATRIDQQWEPLPALPSIGWGFSEGIASPLVVHFPEDWDPLPGLATPAAVSGYECEPPRAPRAARVRVDSWEPLAALPVSGAESESPRAPVRARAVLDGWDPLPALATPAAPAGYESESPRAARAMRVQVDSWEPLAGLGASGAESESPRPPARTRVVLDSWDPLPTLATTPAAAVSGYECESPRPPPRAMRVRVDSWEPVAGLPISGTESESPRAPRRARAALDGWDPLPTLATTPAAAVSGYECESPRPPRAMRVRVDSWEPVAGLPISGTESESPRAPRRARAALDGWDPLPTLATTPAAAVSGYESESPRAPRRVRVAPDGWEPLSALPVGGIFSASPAPPAGRRRVQVDGWEPLPRLSAKQFGYESGSPLPRRARRMHVDSWDPLPALIVPPPTTANNGAMLLA